MRIFVFKFSWIVIICVHFLYLYSGCLNINDRKGRINPFDPDGENWYPPNIDIADTVINISSNDSVRVKIWLNDNNGTVKFVKWESDSLNFQRIDIITGFEDTIYKSDTTITSHKDSVGTTSSVDTSFFKIVKNFQKDTTGYTFIFDTLGKTDTLTEKLSTDSDTSFFPSVTNTDSIYIAVKEYSTVHKIVFDTTLTPSGTYYSYISKFSFSDTGSFYLFSTAVDNDGLESEYRDSVLININ